jgi:hypothetical protein
MDEKLNQLIRDLSRLREEVSEKRPKWWERVFWMIEKMIIPLSIAAVAFFGDMAATKISEGQLALARAGADDRKEEFRRTMQVKYVELFYAEIASGDSGRQNNALGLLKLMDPVMALELSAFVAANPGVSSAVKAQAETARQRIQSESQKLSPQYGSPLDGYVIGIYFIAMDKAAEAASNQIRRHLLSLGLQNTVRLYPSTQEFMESVVPPDSLEVRYEAGIEDRQATMIADALGAPPLSAKATQRTVGSRTPNFVSIFVP